MISRLDVEKPKTKKMNQVNLDALIPRGDMFLNADEPSSSVSQLPAQEFKITELEESSFFYPSLRKPDFQRETSDWTPEKVCDFIESFINVDLIPAIIMWNQGKYNFVIDGAHRISALVAWVRDDYGYGNLSREFFGDEIDEIKKIAKKTQQKVNDTIGTYQSYKQVMSKPESDPKLFAKALKFSTNPIKLQWVSGDYLVAQNSFFKINESATPINKTEKKLLYSRKKPEAIAARAIIHGGGGHKYWQHFTDKNKADVEELAKTINLMLFNPPLKQPIDTNDVAYGGKGYSAQSLELIYNLICLCNDIPLEDKSKKTSKSDINFSEDDVSGDMTKKYLQSTKSILGRIIGKGSPSMGLHPLIYFYSESGRHQFTSLMAWILLIKDMEIHKSFQKFTKIRRNFEDFILQYKIFIHQIVIHNGSGVKSYEKLYVFFKDIIDNLQKGISPNDIIKHLKSVQFYYLKPNEKEIDPQQQKDFSTQTKSTIYINSQFPNPQICPLCNGYFYGKGANADHKTAKVNGGVGNAENGQMTHGYCNSLKGGK